MSSNPYRHADKALKRLYSLTEALFQRLAVLADWDELNVLRDVRSIYDDVETQAEKEYLDIARKSYDDARRLLIPLLPPDKKIDFTSPEMLFVLALLMGYDDKTQVVYRHELDRKRARLGESLVAINDGSDIFNSNATREALRRGVRLLEKQMRNMADTVTDESRRKAFGDGGVKKVRWNTQEDEKVCSVCRERNKVVYPIDKVPAKHPNCRCYLTPVFTRED